MKAIDEKYLAFVRLRPCALCGKGPAEAHHLINRGTYEHKRNDYTAAPMCREDHHSIHTSGLATTINARGITVAKLVETVAVQLVEFFGEKASGASLDIAI